MNFSYDLFTAYSPVHRISTRQTALINCASKRLFDCSSRPVPLTSRQNNERNKMKGVTARTGLIVLTGLVILCISGCQTGTKVADKGQPTSKTIITNVLIEKERAGLNCARISIDSGQIASVYLHSGQYLTALKQIDVKDCPENFRLAWSDYIAAWERKRQQEHATEDTLDAISMLKGDFNDLPATVRCIEAYDTKEAWQNCERVALAYGVDASKLNSH